MPGTWGQSGTDSRGGRAWYTELESADGADQEPPLMTLRGLASSSPDVRAPEREAGTPPPRIPPCRPLPCPWRPESLPQQNYIQLWGQTKPSPRGPLAHDTLSSAPRSEGGAGGCWAALVRLSQSRNANYLPRWGKGILRGALPAWKLQLPGAGGPPPSERGACWMSAAAQSFTGTPTLRWGTVLPS